MALLLSLPPLLRVKPAAAVAVAAVAGGPRAVRVGVLEDGRGRLGHEVVGARRHGTQPRVHPGFLIII